MCAIQESIDTVQCATPCINVKWKTFLGHFQIILLILLYCDGLVHSRDFPFSVLKVLKTNLFLLNCLARTLYGSLRSMLCAQVVTYVPYVPVLYMEEYKGVKIEQNARKLGFRVPKPSFLLFNSISQVLSNLLPLAWAHHVLMTSFLSSPTSIHKNRSRLTLQNLHLIYSSIMKFKKI